MYIFKYNYDSLLFRTVAISDLKDQHNFVGSRTEILSKDADPDQSILHCRSFRIVKTKTKFPKLNKIDKNLFFKWAF